MNSLTAIRERLAARKEPFDFVVELVDAAESARQALDYGDCALISGLLRTSATEISNLREDIEALLRVAEAAQAVVVLELQDSLEWKLVPAIPVVDEVINDLELDRRLTEGLRSLATALDSLDLADPHPERQ